MSLSLLLFIMNEPLYDGQTGGSGYDWGRAACRMRGQQVEASGQGERASEQVGKQARSLPLI